MANIQLQFAQQRLPAPGTARLPTGGFDAAPIGLDTATAGGRALAQGGDQLLQVAEVQRRTEAATRLLEAKTQALRGLSDLERQVATERDPEAATTRFRSEAAAIRARISEDLPDPAARRAFMAETEQMALTRELSIRADARKRLGGEAVSVLEDSLKTYANAAAQARNPAEREMAVAQAQLGLQRAVGSGYLSPEKAGERLRRFSSDVDEASVRRLLVDDPAAAVGALRDPAALPALDPERRFILLDSALRRVNERVGNVDRALAATERAQERQQREAAEQAEKDFNDALRAGDNRAAVAAVDRLRQSGTAGQYARAADALYGGREIPTTPAMEAWLEERLRDRGRPLTREELDKARADRRVNDSIFQKGLGRLAGREDARFREAEDYVGRALDVPSATIADRDLQPWQREAKRLGNGIINDLMIERRKNADLDPLDYVRQRLQAAGDPQRVIDQQRATEALRRVPPEVQTREGLNRLADQMAAHLAYQNLGMVGRQFAATVAPPTVTVNGAPQRVTPDLIARWRAVLDAAGVGPAAQAEPAR